jgi:hydrogenase maturation protease
MEPLRKILVLGLGNPLSGDDGFGGRVLERLRLQGGGLPPGVTLADAHTDLLNRLEDFARYDQVLLIDAVLDPERRQGEPGRVAVFEEQAFQSWRDDSPSAHQVSPLMAVRLFRLLHPEARTRILLVGLLVDEIRRTPHFATDDRIARAADAVFNLMR